MKLSLSPSGALGASAAAAGFGCLGPFPPGSFIRSLTVWFRGFTTPDLTGAIAPPGGGIGAALFRSKLLAYTTATFSRGEHLFQGNYNPGSSYPTMIWSMPFSLTVSGVTILGCYGPGIFTFPANIEIRDFPWLAVSAWDDANTAGTVFGFSIDAIPPSPQRGWIV